MTAEDSVQKNATTYYGYSIKDSVDCSNKDAFNKECRDLTKVIDAGEKRLVEQYDLLSKIDRITAVYDAEKTFLQGWSFNDEETVHVSNHKSMVVKAMPIEKTCIITVWDTFSLE